MNSNRVSAEFGTVEGAQVMVAPLRAVGATNDGHECQHFEDHGAWVPATHSVVVFLGDLQCQAWVCDEHAAAVRAASEVVDL